MTLESARGERLGARSFERKGATCEPIVGDVVLVAAVLLEDLAPRAVPSPPPEPAPAPKPAPEPAPAQEPAVASGSNSVPRSEAPPARERLRIDFALGGGASFGLAPSVSATGDVLAGFDFGRLRLEAGGRATLPASSDGDVAVRTQIVIGRVAPCYGWRVLSPCAVLAVGSLSGEATGTGVVASRAPGQVYAGAGAGLVSRLFVVEDLVFLRASVDLLFSLARGGFDVGTERVWTVPAVAASGILAVGVRLP